MILITGAQRSGTKYVATVLQEAGVNAVHECGRDKDPRYGPSANVDVDVNWLSAWWLPLPNTHVVHLARNPYDSIASSLKRGTFADKPKLYGKWAIEKLEIMQNCESSLERCIYYWVKWNEMIEPYSDHLVRVEELTSDTLLKILQKDNIKVGKESLQGAINNVSRKINTNKRGQNITRDYIINNAPSALYQKAQEYGYFDINYGS